MEWEEPNILKQRFLKCKLCKKIMRQLWSSFSLICIFLKHFFQYFIKTNKVDQYLRKIDHCAFFAKNWKKERCRHALIFPLLVICKHIEWKGNARQYFFPDLWPRLEIRFGTLDLKFENQCERENLIWSLIFM